jgi:hypothetical protein
MNRLVNQFFNKSNESPFEEVVFVDCQSKWEELLKIAPNLPRGWYELSQISRDNRVDFTRDFWLDHIPYNPSAHVILFEFFERLDDIFIVLAKPKTSSKFIPELVYSLEDHSCFFRGQLPASREVIDSVLEQLDVNLPKDYVSFLKIHNGFGKLSEMGLLKIEEMEDAKRRVEDLIMRSERKVRSGIHVIDPKALYPFYEALGLSSFQCFYTDWYPQDEMGNVYLSGIDYTVSDVSDKRSWQENLAFTTFSQWLSFYLQGMNLCT